MEHLKKTAAGFCGKTGIGFEMCIRDSHSFAAAKEHWDTRKAGLTAAQRESHPARFGLVELVNLYAVSYTHLDVYKRQ